MQGLPFCLWVFLYGRPHSLARRLLADIKDSRLRICCICRCSRPDRAGEFRGGRARLLGGRAPQDFHAVRPG